MTGLLGVLIIEGRLNCYYNMNAVQAGCTEVP